MEVNLGKKVFFLYPPSAVENDMLDLLIMNGFECYILKDQKRAFGILSKFPDSLLFINVDTGMKEADWARYIQAMQSSSQTQSVGIGILAFNPEGIRKHLSGLKIPCGFISLKVDVKESARMVMQALFQNDARGKRSSIRISCAGEENATLNYEEPGTQKRYYAKIMDISSAGVAAKTLDFPRLTPSTVLKGVQLKLRGSLLMVDAVYVGARADDVSIRILMFDPKMTPYNKLTIHRFIRQRLQNAIDKLPVF
jgi:hypothetical protein